MKKTLHIYVLLKNLAMMLIDTVLIIFANMAAYWLLANSQSRLLMLYFIIISIITYLSCNFIGKQYAQLWRYATLRQYTNYLISSIVASIILLFINYYFNLVEMRYAIIANIIILALLGMFRVSLYIVRYQAKKVDLKQLNRRRVLIIGAGDAANKLVKDMQEHASEKYELVGYLDDDPKKYHQMINNIKVLGNIKLLAKVVKEYQVDLVILAIPSLEDTKKHAIIQQVKEIPIELKLIPGLSQILNNQVTTSQIRDVSLSELLNREVIELKDERIDSTLANHVVLITGSGGSIGSELVRQIATKNIKKLILVDIYENSLYEISNEIKRKHPELDIEVLIGSIRDQVFLESLFIRFPIKIIFHAAAHKHVPLMEDSPKEAIKNNVFGTYNLVSLADKYQVKRFVMVSTDKAVHPTNVMGATKRTCEMIVQAYNQHSSCEFVSVRFGNVLGSNGSVIPLFKQQIANGGPITLTHQDITRYFMLIPEAVNLVLAAFGIAKGGEIFVLDMGEPVKIYDLAVNLITLSGLRVNKDIEIKITGLRPGEKLYEELLMDEEGISKTSLNKIYVGKASFIDLADLKAQLNDLKASLDLDDASVIKQLKCLVKTYHSADYDKELYEKK